MRMQAGLWGIGCFADTCYWSVRSSFGASCFQSLPRSGKGPKSKLTLIVYLGFGILGICKALHYNSVALFSNHCSSSKFTTRALVQLRPHTGSACAAADRVSIGYETAENRHPTCSASLSGVPRIRRDRVKNVTEVCLSRDGNYSRNTMFRAGLEKSVVVNFATADKKI